MIRPYELILSGYLVQGALDLDALQKLIHQGRLLCKNARQLYDLSRQASPLDQGCSARDARECEAWATCPTGILTLPGHLYPTDPRCSLPNNEGPSTPATSSYQIYSWVHNELAVMKVRISEMRSQLNVNNEGLSTLLQNQIDITQAMQLFRETCREEIQVARQELEMLKSHSALLPQLPMSLLAIQLQLPKLLVATHLDLANDDETASFLDFLRVAATTEEEHEDPKLLLRSRRRCPRSTLPHDIAKA
ncbi:hypothetical protein ACFX2C_028373 [Malus domestica]